MFSTRFTRSGRDRCLSELPFLLPGFPFGGGSDWVTVLGPCEGSVMRQGEVSSGRGGKGLWTGDTGVSLGRKRLVTWKAGRGGEGQTCYRAQVRAGRVAS